MELAKEEMCEFIPFMSPKRVLRRGEEGRDEKGGGRIRGMEFFKLVLFLLVFHH